MTPPRPLVLLLWVSFVLTSAGPGMVAGAHAPVTSQAPSGDVGEWTLDEAPRAGAVQVIGGNQEVLVAVLGDGRLIRSTDGGDGWDLIAGIGSLAKSRVSFSPADPDTGYLASVGGVWRTQDAGVSWTHVLPVERAARLDVSSTGAVAVGVRLADGSNHVLLSRDAGGSWGDLGAPIPTGDPICGIAFGASDDAVMAMTDRQSWYTQDAALWVETPGSGLDFVIEPGGTVWRLDMGDLEKTVDGGASWQEVVPPGDATTGGAHPDGGIYLATAQGLSLTRDGGGSWQNLHHGDQVFDSTSVLADPGDPDAVFVTDARVGLARIQEDGEGVAWYAGRSLPFLDPVAMRDVVTRDDQVAAVGGKGLFMRGPEGRWRHTGAGLGAVDPLGVVAVSAEGTHVYAAGTGPTGAPAVEVSRNGGRTFTSVVMTAPPGPVTHLVVDPSDPTRAVLSSRDGDVDRLLETTDGGGSWQPALPDVPLDVTGLAWHGSSGALLVATSTGGLVRMGGVWSPLVAEGLTTVAAGSGHVVATGLLMHWQSVAPATPVVVPVDRDAPAGATSLVVWKQEVWSLASGLWRCPLQEGPCGSYEVPGIAIESLGVSADQVYLATGDGLFSAPWDEGHKK